MKPLFPLINDPRRWLSPFFTHPRGFGPPARLASPVQLSITLSPRATEWFIMEIAITARPSVRGSLYCHRESTLSPALPISVTKLVQLTRRARGRAERNAAAQYLWISFRGTRIVFWVIPGNICGWWEGRGIFCEVGKTGEVLWRFFAATLKELSKYSWSFYGVKLKELWNFLGASLG